VTANLFKTLLVSSLFLFIFVCYPSLFIACFFIYLLFFSLYFVLFYMYSVFLLPCPYSFVFPVTLSFLLSCLSSYSVFMSFCLFFVILSLFIFLSHFLSPYFRLRFGFIFTLSLVYFLIFLLEYLCI